MTESERFSNDRLGDPRNYFTRQGSHATLVRCVSFRFAVPFCVRKVKKETPGKQFSKRGLRGKTRRGREKARACHCLPLPAMPSRQMSTERTGVAPKRRYATFPKCLVACFRRRVRGARNRRCSGLTDLAMLSRRLFPG